MIAIENWFILSRQGMLKWAIPENIHTIEYLNFQDFQEGQLQFL